MDETFRDVGVDGTGAQVGFQNWTFVELESSQFSIRLASSWIMRAWDVLWVKGLFLETAGVLCSEEGGPRHTAHRGCLCRGQKGKASSLLRGTSEPWGPHLPFSLVQWSPLAWLFSPCRDRWLLCSYDQDICQGISGNSLLQSGWAGSEGFVLEPAAPCSTGKEQWPRHSPSSWGNLGETAHSWSPSSPGVSVSSFVLFLFTEWSLHLPLFFLLLPRLFPKQRMGGAPREEREFVKTGGMTGTSDWLVRAILFPGCHSSHFLGLSVMKLITLFSNNPCNWNNNWAVNSSLTPGLGQILLAWYPPAHTRKLWSLPTSPRVQPLSWVGGKGRR